MRNAIGLTIGNIFGVGSLPPSLFLFQDTFTDTDGVLLTDHTPEVGGPWESYKGTMDITSNGARPKSNGAGNECQQVALSSASDGVVTGSCEYRPNTGFIVRGTDANNFFLGIYLNTSAVQIYEFLGGSFFLRATSGGLLNNFSDFLFYDWEITLAGQSISMEVTGDAGVSIMSYSSANNQTSQKIGLRAFSFIPVYPIFTDLEMVA